MPKNNSRYEDEDEVLGVGDVARIYRCGIDAVIEHIRAGEIKAFNIGRGQIKPRYGIRRSALDEFERRRAIVPSAEKPKRRGREKREQPAKEYV
jgi:hypothetical protein